jgi:hypothetical protein
LGFPAVARAFRHARKCLPEVFDELYVEDHAEELESAWGGMETTIWDATDELSVALARFVRENRAQIRG